MQTITIIEARLEALWYDHDTNTKEGCTDVIDILGRLGVFTIQEVDMVIDAQNLLFAKMRLI